MNEIYQKHQKRVKLYRVCLPEYECLLGVQAVKFLQDRNISFEDIQLRSRSEISEFKVKYQVDTMPQIIFGSKKPIEYADWAAKIQAVESCKYSGGLVIF